MRWSWKIATVAGIPIYIHATFLLLLVWVAFADYARSGSARAAGQGLVLVLLVFGIVVLHELGHALTAKRFGIRTRDITLLPIGGVARLERMPENPWQELLVAVAGPAVNVVLAAAFFAVLLAGGRVGDMLRVGTPDAPLVAQLVAINVTLTLFNMLPAFPMDGGRVLRALLAMRMDYVSATQVAARIGQGMALLFGLLGLAFNPFLAFIALFVWIGASEEAGAVAARWALSGIPVSRAMITDFRALAPGDTLARAAQLILDGFQHDFPVVDGGRVVGILTRPRLMQALAEGRSDTPVGAAMSAQFETADPGEMLEQVLQRLQACGCPGAPVVRDGRLVGMITIENIGELLMIQGALREGRMKSAGESPGQPA